MTPKADVSPEDDEILFVNRDHIISVTVHRAEMVVTTTDGRQLTVPASRATLEKFMDDLANGVQSNFVSIAI
jgi:hypothetical protein